MKNVLEYLERSARLYPDKTAFEDLNQKITYAQLRKACKGHRQRIGRKTCAAFADRRVYGKKRRYNRAAVWHCLCRMLIMS